MKKSFWFVLGCALLCTLGSQGQTIVGNQQVITLPSSPWATTQALLSLPSDYSSSTTQRYPLIIFLHGVGQAGTNISGLLTDQGGIPYRISQGFVPEAVSPIDGKMTKFIVVSPQSPSWSYQYQQIQFILPGILAKYRVDTTRIYITGLSAGGNGALTCITDNPNFCGKIAAVSVMSAASITSTEAAAMKNVDINHLPFWDICGTADPNDFYGPNVSYVNTVMANSPNPVPDSTWLYGVGHSSWFEGYDPSWTGRSGHSKGLNMYTWFLLWQRGNTIPWGPSVPSAPHIPPVAVALPVPATITLPINSLSLNGSTSTDVDGTIASYAWSYISGPATYTLTNAGSANATLSNLVTGTYVFKLTVTDNTGASSSANATILVNPLAAILAPVAKVVSSNIQVNLPIDTTVLNGSPSTPPTGATLTAYQWTVASGPTGAVLKNSTSPMAVLSGLTKGSYKAALVVKDNLGGTASDTVVVNVAAETAAVTPACSGKRITLTQAGDHGIELYGPSLAYSPGDTLVVPASATPYTWIDFTDIYGTATCPVTIINGGGQVLANTRLNCTNCRFVHITGTGSSSSQYGFLLQNNTQTSVGVNVSGRSANVELDHINVHRMDYGIWVKQDQGCIDSLNYPNWTIDHISIHDNRIVGTYDEGMYLGTTDPNGTRVVTCNGTVPNPLPKPLYLSNFSIYNNYIDSTGRSGIQLSDAQTGDNEIYDNHISNSGLQLNPQQGNGISLGGYTQAHIHNNVISNTFTMGIFALGAGVEQIDHNTILLSGNLGGGSPLTASIMVDTRLTTPADSSKFIITNNTLGTNTDVNVRIYNAYPTYAYANLICSNTTPSGAATTMAVPAGIHYTTSCAATVPPKGKPVAKAGGTYTITLPTNTVTLNGTASTDATAPITAYDWAYVNGPGKPVMTNGITVSPVLSNLQIGTYKYLLTITDTSNVASEDTATVVVLPNSTAGTGPVSNTSAADTVYLPTDFTTLNGTGSYARGTGATLSAYQWSVLSAPSGSGYVLTNATTSLAKLSHMDATGAYKVVLKVTDNSGKTALDTSVIIVLNYSQVPVAVISNSTTLTLPSGLTLDGSQSFPTPYSTLVSYQWTQVSGPGASTLTTATAKTTTVTGLVAGTYVFQLTVGDLQGIQGSATITIVVKAATSTSLPPVANAGTAQTIHLPTNSVTLTGAASTDPNKGGSISKYAWTYVSGPVTYSLTNAGSATATVSNLLAGTYVFKLTVTDNLSLSASTTVTITVDAAVASKTSCSGKRIILAAAADHSIKVSGLSLQYSPGDTLVVPYSATPYTSIIFTDIYGTVTCPVTIINSGGQVFSTAGLQCANCRYVHLTGTGSSAAQYGFLVQNSALMVVGVNISGRSSNVEVDHISLHHLDFGFWVKQDQSCIDSLNYPNWTIDHIAIHDNSIVGTYETGIYLGTTDVNGTTAVTCSGSASNPKPLRLSNCSVYNNMVDSTGLSGIQLSGAQTGDNEVYGNHVTNAGLQQNALQGNGISLGGYTEARVHNNIVSNTYAEGLQALGAGSEQIDHNTILLSGNLGGGSPMVPSISVDTRATTPADSAHFIITNNTLGTNTDVHIRIHEALPTYANANVICSNIQPSGIAATYAVPTGVHYTTACPAAAPPNGKPVAKTGGTYTITLPLNTISFYRSSSTDATAPIATYEWSYVSGPGSPLMTGGNTAIPVLSNLTVGTYKYLLTITDTSRAMAEDTGIVVVLPGSLTGTGPVANAYAIDTLYQPSDVVALNGTGSYARGTGTKLSSFQWSLMSAPSGSGAVLANATSVLANLSHMNATGTYKVLLKVTDNNGKTSLDTSVITVLTHGQAPVAVITNGTTLTLPATLVLNGTHSYAAPYTLLNTYQWSQVSGPNTSKLSTPSYYATGVTGLVAGTYVFKLIVGDNQGFQGSTTISILVKAAAVSDAEQGQTSSMDSTANMISGPFNKWSVKLYPNPVQNSLNIWLAPDISGKVTFTIYDVSGRLESVTNLDKPAANSEIETLNVSSLMRGAYFVKVSNAKGQRITLSFIKIN